MLSFAVSVACTCSCVLAPLPSHSAVAFDTSKIIFHFHGTDSTSTIGVRLTPLGDMNGDNYDDIAISSASPGGTYIFYGGNPVDTFPDLFIIGSYGAADPIDLDGDGINDIITTAYYGDNIGAVYFFKGYADSMASVPYDSLYPPVDNLGFGWTVGTGYIDADPLGDMVTKQRNTPGGPTLYYYSGCPALDTIADWTFKVENYSHGFTNFGFIDFDGDDQLDIYLGMAARLDTLSYVYIFLGPHFKDEPDVVIGHPLGYDPQPYDQEMFARRVVNFGDVDGDGWEDLGVTYHYQPIVYLCGPGSDTLPDYWLEGRAGYVSRAGDINGDGYNDLLTGDARTNNGVVDIYLAGAEFDTVCDMSIYRFDLPPLFLDNIGWRLAPAGDFNGDGYNDFMFGCQNFAFGDPHDVFVVNGGPYIVTGADSPKEKQLPSELNLRQNYPNPFNASTMIDFDLPRKDRVTLTIYNLLGQRVVTLIDDQEYSAGKHTIAWDGKLSGNSCASTGVYFYQIATSSATGARKMLMLK